MSALSSVSLATESNRLQAGLRLVASALSAASLDTLAGAIGKDDSTVCRIRSEETKVSMSDAVRLLYAAGQKVVGADKVCVDRETYESVASIASKAMADKAMCRKLIWDDVE